MPRVHEYADLQGDVQLTLISRQFFQKLIHFHLLQLQRHLPHQTSSELDCIGPRTKGSKRTLAAFAARSASVGSLGANVRKKRNRQTGRHRTDDLCFPPCARRCRRKKAIRLYWRTHSYRQGGAASAAYNPATGK